MKTFAKWVAILWSLFCLFGLVSGLISAGQRISVYSSEAQKIGAGIGISIGMGFWVIVWLAIAGPALVIFLVSGTRQPAHDPQEYGKCPACAEIIRLDAKKCRFCGEIFDQ
jgi:hypothetical protein